MLEQLVRPFETLPVTGTRRLVGTSKRRAAETAQLIWGSAGKLPTAVVETEPDGTKAPKVLGADQSHTEIKRQVEEFRVENPDDSTQYVMIERIRKISFDSVSKEKDSFSWTLDKTTGVVTITANKDVTGTNTYTLNATSKSG